MRRGTFAANGPTLSATVPGASDATVGDAGATAANTGSFVVIAAGAAAWFPLRMHKDGRLQHELP